MAFLYITLKLLWSRFNKVPFLAIVRNKSSNHPTKYKSARQFYDLHLSPIEFPQTAAGAIFSAFRELLRLLAHTHMHYAETRLYPPPRNFAQHKLTHTHIEMKISHRKSPVPTMTYDRPALRNRIPKETRPHARPVCVYAWTRDILGTYSCVKV